jgi:hypothetical protein
MILHFPNNQDLSATKLPRSAKVDLDQRQVQQYKPLLFKQIHFFSFFYQEKLAGFTLEKQISEYLGAT